MQEKNNYVAKTFLGLEEVLAEEIRELGGQNVQVINRAVRFSGTKALLYEANLKLHTALRILMPFHSFRCAGEKELYQAVYDYAWEKIFNLYNTFIIDGVVHSRYFKHSHFASLKAKDAIADRFRAKYNRRPSVDKNNPDFRINLHIHQDQCTLSLDSSGDSLHKRGYKAKNVKAPLNEVLAAGLILLSGWDKKSPFVDPMCGSATLPIEAALLANDIAPGSFREHFGFMNWQDFEYPLFQEIRNKNLKRPKNPVRIQGCDISSQAIETSQANLENAGLSKRVELFEESMAEHEPPRQENGVAIINPPYGQKLKSTDLDALYQNIGDVLKQKYTGYRVWVFSSNWKALKNIGLHASQKHTLYNGPLECRYQKYSIYGGSKKNKQT
ncbi:MAG TPA: THUMP domain-containing protein [Bacteroidales bacterium]|nr:THUMP domain-containing protein [Bacteroidales bacterium]